MKFLISFADPSQSHAGDIINRPAGCTLAFLRPRLSVTLAMASCITHGPTPRYTAPMPSGTCKTGDPGKAGAPGTHAPLGLFFGPFLERATQSTGATYPKLSMVTREINDLPVTPEIADLPLDQLSEAPWNPNQMAPSLLAKLECSVRHFGLTGVLVVKPIGDGLYEALSGNQRRQVLRKLKWKSAPCAVVEIGDAKAKLLAQTLNRLQGSDDLGLRAELVNDILTAIPTEDVLAKTGGGLPSRRS